MYKAFVLLLLCTVSCTYPSAVITKHVVKSPYPKQVYVVNLYEIQDCEYIGQFDDSSGLSDLRARRGVMELSRRAGADSVVVIEKSKESRGNTGHVFGNSFFIEEHFTYRYWVDAYYCGWK